MAYDLTKFTKLSALKAEATRVKAELDKDRARIKALEDVGAQANVLEGVKVNGTALSIADKIVDILVATGSANGTLAVNGADVAVKGLAALAYKAEVSESELATALATKINGKAEAATLNTLIGTDTGKSARAIAAEELAKQLIPENAKESMDTLAEIAAWIQAHPDDASGMNTNITKLQGILAGIGGDSDTYKTVAAYVEAQISALDFATITAGKADKVTGATAGNFAGLDSNGNLTDSGKKASDFVAAEAGKRLMTTEEGTKLAGIAANATKVEASDTNGKIKIDGVETTVYTAPSDMLTGSVATDAEVAEMLVEVFGAQA